MAFKQPPVIHNENGELRKVGFELEFTNVDTEASARIIQEIYGGEILKENRFLQKVVNTSVGDFTVEFDLTFLTEKKYKKAFEIFDIHPETIKFGDRTLEENLEALLESVTGKIFPFEIACPPVCINQLDRLEALREALFRNHAQGTESFPTNAFGTHINVEIPTKDVTTMLAYIRAFILLYPYLLEVGKTDLARKLSPFIDPYPDEFADLILDNDYAPDLDTFIRDYHYFNPDRNRPLDLYPLFAALNKNLLTQYTGLGKVKPRNTFHYRLPNSSISEPTWTLAQEWNNWVTLEELAHDREKIKTLSQEYLAMKKDTIIGFETRWNKRTKEWLFLST